MSITETKTFKLSKSGNTILLITVLIMALLATFFTINTYFTQTEIYRDKELGKLLAIVNTLSQTIDGDMHRQLEVDYPAKDDIFSNETDERYRQIQELLARVKEENGLETTIYTMVYDSLKSKFCFILNSEDHPFWKHDYKDFPSELLENYHHGGVIHPYRDRNGYWLSAFAPIKDSQGRTVAVLQADQRFDDFRQKIEQQVYQNIFISLGVILLLSLLLLINVRILLKKEEALKQKSMELDGLRKEFIANVSHDLRTPLASIQGYLETIEMKKGLLETEKLMKYVGISLSSAGKLRQMIDELFELSKLESKDRKIDLEKFNVQELLIDIINGFRPAATAKNITLTGSFENNLPRAEADMALIERMVSNLLSNAVKFTPEGGEVKVMAGKVSGGKKVKISVVDTGPGLDSEHQNLIFQRMYSGSKQTGGSGLGLAIAKSILQMHNSELAVESQPGHGAAFSFTLKAAKN